MSRFIKNTIKLAGSTTAAQLISALLSPIQTRIFSPEAYGIYGFFFSITATFSILSTARYEYSIIAVDNKDKAKNLFAITLLIPIFFSIILGLLIMRFGNQFFSLIGDIDLSPYYGAFIITVLISGITMLFKYYNIKHEQFNLVAIVNLVNTSLSSVLILTLGILGMNNSSGLIYGNLLGTLVAWTIPTFFFLKDDLKSFILKININEMLHLLKYYSKPSIINTFSAFINNFSVQVPSILLASLFGPEINGYYALGFKILKMPSILIGQALSHVFFQTASEEKQKGSISILIEQSMAKLINIGLFPTLLLTINGKDLVSVVFGSSWGEAGVYMQILGLWIFAAFISSPLSTALVILEKNEFFLKFNILLLISRLVSVYAGYLMANSRYALFFMSFSGVILYIWMGWFLLRFTKANFDRLLKNIYSINRLTIPLLLEAVLIKLSFSGNSLLITINTLLLVLVFVFILIWKDHEINSIAMHYLNAIFRKQN